MSDGFKGADELRRRLERLSTGTLQEGAQALYEVAMAKLPEIRRRTPVKTGALRASEVVLRPLIEGGRATVSIVAGGPSAPYSIEVHERLDFFHKVGGTKFLESVTLESIPTLVGDVAPRMDLNKMVS